MTTRTEERRHAPPSGTRRLTSRAVRAVRAIRANRGGMTMAMQALVYGVSRRTIQKVRYYETWRWVR